MTTENDLRNGQAIYVYSQKNEGKAKTTEDLILIDIIDASEYDEIRRCPKEASRGLQTLYLTIRYSDEGLMSETTER
jgi:hypothetical protein